MLSGVDNWQGPFVTATVVVELLLSVSGSGVVLLALTVLESTVPFVTASTTYVATKSALSPRARVVMVQVVVPVSPTFGFVQVNNGPDSWPNDWNVVLAGTSSVNWTDAASLGPKLVTSIE